MSIKASTSLDRLVTAASRTNWKLENSANSTRMRERPRSLSTALSIAIRSPLVSICAKSLKLKRSESFLKESGFFLFFPSLFTAEALCSRLGNLVFRILVMVVNFQNKYIKLAFKKPKKLGHVEFDSTDPQLYKQIGETENFTRQAREKVAEPSANI
jgi:hypothetical protein